MQVLGTLGGAPPSGEAEPRTDPYFLHPYFLHPLNLALSLPFVCPSFANELYDIDLNSVRLTTDGRRIDVISSGSPRERHVAAHQLKREGVMRQKSFFCLCVLATPFLNVSATVASAASAAIVFDGLPDSYVPGQPIAFELRLPAITNLGAYNIDVVLESDMELAGVDYELNQAASLPADVDYVFSSTVNFASAVNVDNSRRHRLTLSDFDLSGTGIVPAGNDRVGTIVINTLASSAGSLKVSIDGTSLILDTPAVTPTPVDQFDAIRDAVLAAEPASIAPVPEPSALAICGLTIVCLARRRRAGYFLMPTSRHDIPDAKTHWRLRDW